MVRTGQVYLICFIDLTVITDMSVTVLKEKANWQTVITTISAILPSSRSLLEKDSIFILSHALNT